MKNCPNPDDIPTHFTDFGRESFRDDFNNQI